MTIFIRTYHKDLKWLQYCLKSIHKNLVGWDEIVICIPKGQEPYLSHLTSERVVTSKIYRDDYLGQQLSKIKAHQYINYDYILFVDSDCIFKPNSDIRDYFHDNKPVILKQRYENVGDAICWKEPTEDLFQEYVPYEYMRRAPQLFLRETLINFNTHFPFIEDYVVNLPYRRFSEFNALGYFAEKMESEKYSIIDIDNTDIKLPENKCMQFWSWGGVENNIKRIEELIG